MTRVYRILRKRFARNPLDGEGAYLFGGRWSSRGTRLAYTAERQSLAMVEYFVHIDPADLPGDLVLVSAEIPDSVSRFIVAGSRLPANWWCTPPPPELAAIGDGFAQEKRAAVLIVPSALAPTESNWLINPEHGDFRKIRVQRPERFQYDSRFFNLPR